MENKISSAKTLPMKFVRQGDMAYHKYNVSRSEIINIHMRLSRFINSKNVITINTPEFSDEQFEQLKTQSFGEVNIPLHKPFIHQYGWFKDHMENEIKSGNLVYHDVPKVYSCFHDINKSAFESKHYCFAFLEKTRLQSDDFIWCMSFIQKPAEDDPNNFDIKILITFNQTDVMSIRNKIFTTVAEAFDFVNSIDDFQAIGIELLNLSDYGVPGLPTKWWQLPYEMIMDIMQNWNEIPISKGVDMVEQFFKLYGDCLDFKYSRDQVIVEVNPPELQRLSDVLVAFLEKRCGVHGRKWYNNMLRAIIDKRDIEHNLYKELKESVDFRLSHNIETLGERVEQITGNN